MTKRRRPRTARETSKRPTYVSADITVPAPSRIRGDAGTLHLISFRKTKRGIRFVCEAEDGERYLLTAQEMFQSVRRDPDAATESRWNDVAALTPVDPDVLARATVTAKVFTGSPHHDFQSTAWPAQSDIDPKYDPGVTTLEQRIELGIAELRALGLGASRATFHRWRKLLKEQGLDGLVHGNTIREVDEIVDPDDASVDAGIRRLVADLDKLGRRMRDQPMISETAFRVRCRRALGFAPDTELPFSRSRWRREVRRVYKRYDLDLEFDRRSSRRSRMQRANETWSAQTPYEVVQIDTTPLDMDCLDADGNVISRVNVVLAIDVCTRRVLAMDFIIGDPDGYTIRRILVRMMLGWYERLGVRAEHPNLPRSLVVVPEFMVRIGAIGIDRGSNYVEQNVLSMLARFGIDVMIARPRSGSAKPIVESFFHWLNSELQQVEGYHGPRPQSRGKLKAKQRVLPFEAVAESLWQYIAEVYHQTPHRALRVGTSRKNFTPDEMLARHLEVMGDIKVETNLKLLLALLDHHTQQVHAKGVSVDQAWYSDGEGRLNELRGQHTVGVGRTTKRYVSIWQFGHQPDFILVQASEGGDIFVCTKDALDAEPAFQDVLDETIRNTYLNIAPNPERSRDSELASDRLIRDLEAQAQPQARAKKATKDAHRSRTDMPSKQHKPRKDSSPRSHEDYLLPENFDDEDPA